MIKKIIFGISIVVNVILAVVLVANIRDAKDELKFAYVEKDTIRPDSLRAYLDRENYGTAASLSHPIRGGAEVAEEYEDYYLLGEYADLLFLKEIFEGAGNADTVRSCEQRLKEISEKMPEYSAVFEKMLWSLNQALGE